MYINSEMSFTDINHLIYAIELRDAYTQGHSVRVAKYAYALSSIMKLDFELSNQIYIASLLHDVGKIGIPDAVLLKPGKLEQTEYELIQQHSPLSGKILEKMENFKYLAPMVTHHHEDYNGKGYPDKLKGEEIPLGARIISIVDVFDALTTRRVYRGAMTVEKALNMMDDMQKSLKFDPDIYKTFMIMIKEHDIVDLKEIEELNNLKLSELDMLRNNFFFSDSLTKLLNRDALIALLRKCADFEHTIICGKLDIKNFRNYNKLYGTLKGDDLLRKCSRIMKNNLKAITTFKEPSNNNLFLFRLHADIFVFLYVGKKLNYIEFKIDKLSADIHKECGVEIEYKPVINNEKAPKNIEKMIGHML